MGLMKNVDECVDIGERAYKEFNIESMLNEMQTAWQTIVFEVAAYKTSYIIRGYDEI
jgi:dynein heavy chain